MRRLVIMSIRVGELSKRIRRIFATEQFFPQVILDGRTPGSGLEWSSVLFSLAKLPL